MSDVKRLLDEATPPDEWATYRYQNGGGRVSVGNRLLADFYEEGERELFLHARTRLPDYEAAVEALEALVAEQVEEILDDYGRWDEEEVLAGHASQPLEAARAALARLRGES